MIGKVTLAIGIVVAALGTASLAHAANADIVAEVTAAQKTLDEAFKARDSAAIKRLTTPDHVSVTPNYAAALNIAQQLATLPDIKITAYKTHKTTITPIGTDLGVATMVKSYQGTFKGKPLPPYVFATAIWTKSDGTWRERLYQETTIKEP